MIINKDACIPILPYLREVPGEHIDLPIKTGIFPVKIVRNQDAFVLQKEDQGRYLLGKGKSQQFFSENKESNNDPTESNSINQSNMESC